MNDDRLPSEAADDGSNSTVVEASGVRVTVGVLPAGVVALSEVVGVKVERYWMLVDIFQRN